MFIFVDAFKLARGWIPHRPSDETWDTGEAIDFDDKGWVVRSLPPDQEAETLMMAELERAIPADAGPCCTTAKRSCSSIGTPE